MTKLVCHLVLNVSCAHIVELSERKASTIQYGYKKCGTHARVFSQTLKHGNSKNEKEKDEVGKKRGVSI